MLSHKPKKQKANTKRSDKKQSLITLTQFILFHSIFFLFPQNRPISRRLRRFTGYRIWECSLFYLLPSLIPLFSCYFPRNGFISGFEGLLSPCVLWNDFIAFYSLSFYFLSFFSFFFREITLFSGFSGLFYGYCGFGKVMV